MGPISKVDIEEEFFIIDDKPLTARKIDLGELLNIQARFSQKGSKSLPKFTSENLKNIPLEDGCLAEGHF